MLTPADQDEFVTLLCEIVDLLNEKASRPQIKCLIAFACLSKTISQLPRDMRRQISAYVKKELDNKVAECLDERMTQ